MDKSIAKFKSGQTGEGFKIVPDCCLSATYAELVEARNAGKLIAGAKYRITDYETITAQTDTQSAGHLFDIIVTADSDHSLCEEAYAAPHEGETYFENSNLSAWKLKYTLDNDSTRFIWADEENGKGVIYEMEDEFGNKCAYDFKNILFKRFKTTKSGAFYHNLYFGFTSQGSDYPSGATFNKNDVKYLYTFTTYTSNYGEIKDASLNAGENGVTCWQNVIPACYDAWGDYVGVGYLLNNIVLQGNGGNFYNNSFGAGCVYCSIGNGFNCNSIGNSFSGNTIGNNFNNNSIGNGFNCNSIGNDCNNFTIGKDYVRYIEIEDGNKNFTLTSTQTTSSSNYLQNICISRGVNNSDSAKTISHNSVGDEFKTTYQNSNSTTVNV